MIIAEEKDDGTAVEMIDEGDTGIGTDLGATGGQKVGATVKETGARPKEKGLGTSTTEKKDKKKGKDDRQMDTVKSTDPDTTDTIRDDDLHTVETIETETEVEETESIEEMPVEAKGDDSGPRRSQKDRKVPQRLGLYYTHQITNRPVDRRLQTLQMLLGTGILMN